MFDVNVNGTSQVFLNSHWFDSLQIQYLLSETQTYLQCISNLQLLNTNIYGVINIVLNLLKHRYIIDCQSIKTHWTLILFCIAIIKIWY